MKRIASPSIYAVILLTIFSCREERIKERPEDIIPSTVNSEVFKKIMEEFPESKDVKVSHSTLFAPATQKQVVLANESDVYVTYISEGASYSNSFGWYSYNGADKPTQPSDIDVHLLFPTVSERILNQGDMLRLGDSKFPAGTVIGFFLIIKGWEDGEVHYDRETFYSDFEVNGDDQQQHILFKQKDLGNLILAFEDVLTTQSSDQDYNDIIFMVTDNTTNQPVTNFNLTNVIEF
jgi:hypothetical protein